MRRSPLLCSNHCINKVIKPRMVQMENCGNGCSLVSECVCWGVGWEWGEREKESKIETKEDWSCHGQSGQVAQGNFSQGVLTCHALASQRWAWLHYPEIRPHLTCDLPSTSKESTNLHEDWNSWDTTRQHRGWMENEVRKRRENETRLINLIWLPVTEVPLHWS